MHVPHLDFNMQNLRVKVVPTINICGFFVSFSNRISGGRMQGSYLTISVSTHITSVVPPVHHHVVLVTSPFSVIKILIATEV